MAPAYHASGHSAAAPSLHQRPVAPSAVSIVICQLRRVSNRALSLGSGLHAQGLRPPSHSLQLNGAPWAEQVVQTTGAPAALAASTDRAVLRADGTDLAFITVRVTDAAGRTAPRANDLIQFQIDGPGEIVATDNGDPTDMTPFPSPERRAFGGLALAIVRPLRGQAGPIQLRAASGSLRPSRVTLQSVRMP